MPSATFLADIAARFHCPERGRILNLRTVRTILTTLFALPFPWKTYQALSAGMAIVYVIVAIWICAVLFSFQRSLSETTPEVEGTR